MEFLRPKKSDLSLDMAPLIDIVFQLLIFFMLSSSFLTPSMKLNLPKAVSTEKGDAQNIVVSVDKDGEVFVNTEKSSMDDLSAILQSRLANNEKKSVDIRGDREMPYHYFVDIMDKARQAGARQINVVHQSAKS